MSKFRFKSIVVLLILSFVNVTFSEDVPEKTVCDVCTCNTTQVTCSALMYPDVLQTYNGDNALRLTITESHLGPLQKELFTKFHNVPSVVINSNKLILESSSISTLTEVTNLNMENNSIEIIPQGFFDYNTKLISLNLTYNEIPFLANNTFKNLQHLTKLLMGNNTISHVDIDAFVGLSALEELDLSGNRLERLEATALAPLTRLRVLRLENNRLASFGPPLMEIITRPGLTASLQGNPLHCVCGELRDAWAAATARGVRLALTCASGQAWNVAMKQLSCAGAQPAVLDTDGVLTIGEVLRRAREEGEVEQLSPAEVVALAEGVVIGEALQPRAAAVWRATLDAEATLQQKDLTVVQTSGSTAWPVFLLCVVLTALACILGMTIYKKVKNSVRAEPERTPYYTGDHASTSSPHPHSVTYTFQDD